MTRADCGLFFRVVVNREGRYSIWPTELAVPAGWRPTGFSGSRQACLNQVAELWRDMRPRPETGPDVGPDIGTETGTE